MTFIVTQFLLPTNQTYQQKHYTYFNSRYFERHLFHRVFAETPCSSKLNLSDVTIELGEEAKSLMALLRAEAGSGVKVGGLGRHFA